MKRFTTFLLAALLSVVTYAQGDGEHVRLTNLPHVYVNTFTGYSVSSKNTYVYARMWWVDENDQVQYFDSLQIRVRGNSTASMAKKPYKLKFLTKVKLLGKGRPNTKKWTLLANHGDKTLLRNALTSLMGERAGLKFNPAAKFVDLTLNGQYVGTYQVSDHIDVRPHRVNVAEQDYPLTAESNITGGYLLEADGFKDFTSATGFYTNQGVPVKIHYPDDDEIDPSQVSYITHQVNTFESRLFGSAFTDAEAGYRPLVDSLSLVQWYLCTEISANVDGFFSAYFYKHQDDPRLYFGPLWDYDIAYNNDNRSRAGTNNTERQLMSQVGYGGGYGGGNRIWVSRMWEDPWFARMVNREFKALVDGGLEDALNAKIDSLTDLINESQQLNYQRWGISTRTFRELVLYSTYGQYVKDLRTFIGRHLEYLSSAFAALQPDTPEPQPEPEPSAFVVDNEYFYTIRNAGTSTYADVDATSQLVCANGRNPQSYSQQWRLYSLANGAFLIRNMLTWTALCDVSPEGATAQTEVGTQLALTEADSTDIRQQWDLVAQGDGRYNIVSRSSRHAANLSGGNTADGTPILSYTSDARNATSGNRLWIIDKSLSVNDVPTRLTHVTTDYALAYDPASGRLHFGAEDISALTFVATIYNQSGQRVATFPATSSFNMFSLPVGIYIISWQHDGRTHSVKLAK